MKQVLTILLSLCAATAMADETVAVYQLTGAIQCVDGTGIPPEDAADPVARTGRNRYLGRKGPGYRKTLRTTAGRLPARPTSWR